MSTAPFTPLPHAPREGAALLLQVLSKCTLAQVQLRGHCWQALLDRGQLCKADQLAVKLRGISATG